MATDLGQYFPALAGLAIAGTLLLIAFVVFAVVYVYMALTLMTIAKKTKTPNAWLAWIPLANVYLMTQIGKTPVWTMFGLLAVFLPFIGTLVVAGLSAYWWWKIAEARGKQGWLGILMLVPIANFIVPGYLAWSK